MIIIKARILLVARLLTKDSAVYDYSWRGREGGRYYYYNIIAGEEGGASLAVLGTTA